MRVVISSLDEEDALSTQQEILSIDPDLSFSPCRAEPSLDGCIEFYGTGPCDEKMKETLLSSLNNDWDHDEDDELFWAYGFNTRMFSPIVYYMNLDFS